MAGDMVTILQICGVCRTEIGTIQVKKENMMLSTTTQAFCPNCKEQRSVIRDVAGRLATIQQEVETYPKVGAP